MPVFQRLSLLPVALLLLSLGLGGCAGKVTPSTRYLLPAATPAVPDAPEATLQLGRLSLAHYLDVEGIVMQLDDIELREAQDHRWAEGLDQQLMRNLQAYLSQDLPSWRVIQGSAGNADAYTLHVSVDQFQGRQDGYALTSGQWQLRSVGGDLLHMASFSTRTALEQDGYPALVRALGQSFEQAAGEIATGIRRAVL